MKRQFLTLLSCLAGAGVQAQALDVESVDEEVEVKRYAVEVIIFTYEEDVHTGTEIFRPDPPPDDDVELLDDESALNDAEIPTFSDSDASELEEDEEKPPHWIVAPPGIEILDEETREPYPFQLVLAGEDEYMLSDALRQFELLEAYETLLHVAWTQPAYPELDTPSIELGLFGEVPDGLEGSLTLYLSRYLHLVVDLTLDGSDGAQSIEEGRSFSSFGDSSFVFRDRQVAQAIRWRIQENRIFKNGDLRYFDHPKFGVLAKVVRIEDEESEVPDDGDLLGGVRQ